MHFGATLRLLRVGAGLGLRSLELAALRVAPSDPSAIAQALRSPLPDADREGRRPRGRRRVTMSCGSRYPRVSRTALNVLEPS
jgi:hypothetical protein